MTHEERARDIVGHLCFAPGCCWECGEPMDRIKEHLAAVEREALERAVELCRHEKEEARIGDCHDHYSAGREDMAATLEAAIRGLQT